MLSITLPATCVYDCTHSGPCDADVRYWLAQPEIADQMAYFSNDALAACLKPYGAWNAEELQDRRANLERFLWIAAGDAKEDSEWNGEDAIEVYIDSF